MLKRDKKKEFPHNRINLFQLARPQFEAITEEQKHLAPQWPQSSSVCLLPLWPGAVWNLAKRNKWTGVLSFLEPKTWKFVGSLIWRVLYFPYLNFNHYKRNKIEFLFTSFRQLIMLLWIINCATSRELHSKWQFKMK